MKKIILTIISLLSIGILTAFAVNYNTLYDCIDNSNNITIYSDINPLKLQSPSKICSFLNHNTNSPNYTGCINEIRKLNATILRLYNSGKCKRSKYQISGQYGNTECQFTYDLSGQKIIEKSSSNNNKSETNIKYYSSYSNTSNNESFEEKKCYTNLATILKLKYPNIKGDKNYGFKEDITQKKEDIQDNDKFSNSFYTSIPSDIMDNLKNNRPYQNKNQTYYCEDITHMEKNIVCMYFNPKNTEENKQCLNLYNQGKCKALTIKINKYRNCNCACPYSIQNGKKKWYNCMTYAVQNATEDCSICETNLKNIEK